MMTEKEILIENYNYELDQNRIAQYPLKERDHSKLLIYRNNAISDAHFYDLPDQLDAGELLVYNNTKVIRARLYFQKESGATIEIFCLEPIAPAEYESAFEQTESCVWKCMVGNLKKWKEGLLVHSVCVGNEVCDLSAELIASGSDMTHQIRFAWDNDNISFADILAHFGELPIPPYLHRKSEDSDTVTYQTVYSRIDGSVAAPTAGLHFTVDVLRALALKGIREDEVTLHVGAGTFHPVKSDAIGEHPMHAETIAINRITIADLLKQPRVVAVGTTSVRTLESLYYLGCHILDNPTNPTLTVEQWEPYENHWNYSTQESLQAIYDYLAKYHLPALHAATRIIIVPGFEFRIVGKLLTNFHQPKSTLLLLVAAFVGETNWRRIYQYAMDNDFRFLSYGDSSLLVRS